MKKIINFTILYLLFIVIIGCKSNKQENKINETEFQNIDTILRSSEENFNSVSRANQKSDSSISKKVEKTVNQINTLKNEVKELKKENNELKTKINDANDVGEPFQLLPVSNDKDNR